MPGIGFYPAALCCHLITPKPIRPGLGRQQTMPRITEKEGETIPADLTAGTKLVYKYFDLTRTKRITVTLRGSGTLMVNGSALDAHGVALLTGGPRDTLTIEVLSGKVDVISFALEG